MTEKIKAIIVGALSFPFWILASNHGGAIGGNRPNNDSSAGGSVSIPNPLGDITITGLLQSILEIIIIFAIPIIVFFIIYAGFLYVTARGNVETISKAHRALLYALIGGVLILGANVLIEVIGNTVNEFKR